MGNCSGRLCPRFIISQAVTFADGTLTVNLPEGAYADGGRYCIVIAQTIPEATAITAPVVFTVGDGTAEYPLTNRCCAPILASGIRTRTRYPVQVVTNATGGSFRLLGNACSMPDNRLTALDGTVPAADGGA